MLDQLKNLVLNSGRHLGAAAAPSIFWKTIVFCSKTIEICDVIFSKQ